MDVSLSQAANAYASRMQAEMEGEGDEAAASGGGATGSVADTFSQLMNDAITTQKNAEALQMSAITDGKAPMEDVVTAIAAAEISLSTVVAIRDRVIQAYQSIISMAI